MSCSWQVEIDDYATRVLEKHWPDVRRYRDVKEIHGIVAHASGSGCETRTMDTMGTGKQTQRLSTSCSSDEWDRQTACPNCLPSVDVITGGFPCQPHSVAGKRKGADDDRNLWPEYLRIIEELGPTWVVGENVPGIITTYLDTVLSDLESAGYEIATFNIPAVAFDAPHRRERIFVVAYSESTGARANKHRIRRQSERLCKGNSPRFVAYSKNSNDTKGGNKGRGASAQLRNICSRSKSKQISANYWPTEPSMGRVAHGVPNQVDRLKGLGNAVVPAVAEFIGRAILTAVYT